MNTRTKKRITYTASIILLLGVAFFISMEEYQKENMSRLLSQIFSSNEASN